MFTYYDGLRKAGKDIKRHQIMIIWLKWRLIVVGSSYSKHRVHQWAGLVFQFAVPVFFLFPGPVGTAPCRCGWNFHLTLYSFAGRQPSAATCSSCWENMDATKDYLKIYRYVSVFRYPEYGWGRAGQEYNPLCRSRMHL